MAGTMHEDPRIHFAAERTFLAWIRTGLALMGFGFVVARFGLFLKELAATRPDLGIKSSGFSIWVGTALILAGVVVNIGSTIGHVMMIRALKDGTYEAGRISVTAVVLALMLGAAGFAMAAYLLLVR